MFEVNDLIAHERLKEVLHYEPVTGVWTWLVTLNSRAMAGERAGGPSGGGRGQWQICVDYRSYIESQLAWFYMRGTFPKHLIDHKGNIVSNDRWLNLRAA